MGDASDRPRASRETPSHASSASVREASVQQAVVFLSDPRVRGADLGKAAAFLRSKGVTEEEIRQAFARTGLIYPPPHASAASPPSHFPHNPVYFPAPSPHAPPPPARTSSWWPLLFGVAAAAAAYSAGRELLRQYVVPLYFPDESGASRGGTSGGEIPVSSQRDLSRKDDDIVALTDRVDALAQLSKRTSDSVERLARTVDAAREKNDRSAVAISELRDAIRLLSQSISASRGDKHDAFGNGMSGVDAAAQSSSVAVIDTSSVMADDDRDSVAYTHAPTSALHTTTTNRKMGILAYGTSAPSSVAGTNESTYASNRTDRRSVGQADADRDDFLNLAPAEVQDDWRCVVRGRASVEERQSCTSTKSGDATNDVRDDGRESHADGAKKPIDADQATHDTPGHSDKSLHGASAPGVVIAHAMADAGSPAGGRAGVGEGDEGDGVDENGGSTWDGLPGGSESREVAKSGRYKEVYDESSTHDYDSATYAMDGSGGRGIAAARMLFEADILAETRGLFGQTTAVGGSGASKPSGDRPVSMPAMDAPLSDVE